MKLVQFFFLAFGSLFLFSETYGQLSSNAVGEWKPDLLQAGSDFKCPFVFGSFPDPDDCANYYVCIAGRAFHKKCRMFQAFDMMTRRCMPFLIAVCGNNKDKSTASTSVVTVTTPTTTTPDGDNFVCSSFSGSFPHPNDCSKYFSCFLYRHSLKTCPEKQLFDAVKKSCEPEAEVHCGTRQRPPGLTTTEIPDITTTVISITPSVKDETPVETVKDETPMETDTTDDMTDTPTTTEITTIITEVQPTGPPEHDCNEDDLDCIITETGDANDWFKCPQDVGSYAHPSSDKLFIFCMNWIPSVKKCGLDLQFSRELSTCISIKYLL